MKLQAEIGDEKKEVEIRQDGRRLTASVDGRSYDLEVSEPEPGVFLFKHDSKIYEAVVSDRGNATEPMHVRIGSTEFDVRLIDPKRLRGTGSGTEHGDGVAEIKTAMPGKVVRILVNGGAAVSKGDGIVVVEAMKMQNELKSPKDGVVKDIRTSEGSTVAAGDVLATIE